MEDKIVEVCVQNSYGNNLLYPKNTNAVLFAEMAKTRTLTMHTVGIIKQLGYEIKVVPWVSPEVQRIVSKK